MCPLRCTLGRPAKPSKFDLLPCCYSKLPAAHERLGTACRKYGVKFSSKRLPSIPFPERFGSSVTQYYVSLIRSFVVKHRCLQLYTSQKSGQKFESTIQRQRPFLADCYRPKTDLRRSTARFTAAGRLASILRLFAERCFTSARYVLAVIRFLTKNRRASASHGFARIRFCAEFRKSTTCYAAMILGFQAKRRRFATLHRMAIIALYAVVEIINSV